MGDVVKKTHRSMQMPHRPLPGIDIASQPEARMGRPLHSFGLQFPLLLRNTLVTELNLLAC